MRILTIAFGSRGDLEPYLALNKGLQQAGHQVRILTHENFAGLVREQGLELYTTTGNVQDIAQGMGKLLENGNFISILSKMAKEARSGALALANGGVEACQGMDAIMTGIGGLFTGLALAEKFSLPLIQAYYIPFTPTQAYPSFLFPKLPSWLGKAPNRLTYHIARQVMWQAFRSSDRAARLEVLDLPPAPFMGPFRSVSTRNTPVLYGYSPSVIPPPSDWEAPIHVTGYWFSDPPAGWYPPPAVEEFLRDGPPPVYLGFGSMSSSNPTETVELVLEALYQTKQRAIILSGWNGMHKVQLPETVLSVDSIPFSWLFSRVAAVVHHGGAGTTAAGLRSGVPSVIIPYFGDQPYWGQRVEELGVGPEPIPRKKLTAIRLAQAIDNAVTDPEIRQRAASLGSKIQAENGVARAVEIIQDYAGR